MILVSSYGQNASDTIVIKKTLETTFRLNGKSLTPGQLLKITQTNEEAYAEMKMAKSNYNLSSALGFAGGFMVGWPIGTAIAGGDPVWPLAAAGAILIAVSIPFSKQYVRHAKSAVLLYNNGIKSTAMINVDFRIGFTDSGFGLKVTF